MEHGFPYSLSDIKANLILDDDLYQAICQYQPCLIEDRAMISLIKIILKLNDLIIGIPRQIKIINKLFLY